MNDLKSTLQRLAVVAAPVVLFVVTTAPRIRM